MADIKIKRYNPRKDKEALIDLVCDFEYRSLYPIDVKKFEKEIDDRVKDLKLRNSIVLAKEDGNLVGAGFFTIWSDYLGNDHCYVHNVVTRKEDSFKKGIEELLLKELFKYLKKTMKVEKVGLWAKKRDSNFQSVLMKMGIKKNRDLEYYEHDL